MKHPEVLLVPALMFVDHFLTVAGAVWKTRKYDDHFRTPSYELNPMWQEHIAKKKWWNPKHTLLTIVVAAVLACVVEFEETPEFFVRGLLGALFVLLGAIIGRHVSNLLMFTAVLRRPQEISGQVTMTHSLVLLVSLYQCVVVVIPLILIALFSPNPFTIGGVIGAVLLMEVHRDWIRKYRKNLNRLDNQGENQARRSD